jgi:hypothetical protein
VSFVLARCKYEPSGRERRDQIREGKKMIRSTSLLCTLAFTVALSAQDLGPHDINGLGCLSCHTSTNVDPSNVAATYLWGDFNNTTYSTYGGGTLTAGPDMTDRDPQFYSAACLVCHDGAVTGSCSKFGISLSDDHPVNVPYRLGTDGHWPGTVTAKGVRFLPGNFDVVYGRAVRFYVASGTPYVECSSCHDPHQYSVAPVTINGHLSMKPTAKFVRGWYDRSPGSNSTSQFCRSCHFEMSNEASGILSMTQ